MRDLAEQLDAHRKRQQALHPDLTLTDTYNVLEKLRSFSSPLQHSEFSIQHSSLSEKEKRIHDQSLASLLLQIHNDLDAAVFEAYGWDPAISDDQLLQNLVNLNAQRHAEEQQGTIRYLRPEFQAKTQETQSTLNLLQTPAAPKSKPKATTKKTKLPFPSSLADQARALLQILCASPTPLTLDQIASHFIRPNKPRL